jgi:YVTN family beta-propeller protein
VFRNLVSVVLVLLSASVLTTRAADTSPIPGTDYTVAKSWPLGGGGGWDYLALEASGARLFVSRGDRVEVVETVSGRLTGSIARTAGVHGVAFAPVVSRGFTSNGRSNTVSVFELDSLRVIQEVPVSGKNPDAIAYEPQHNHIVTANADSANLSVIDAGTLQVTATIALPGAPEFMVSDQAGLLYVNIVGSPGKIAVIDGKSLAVKSTWTLTGCVNPTGLTLDLLHHRLFSVCGNQIMAVTDSVSGKQVARVVIGSGPDAVAYDPELGLVFSSNGQDGTLTVIHQDTPDEYRVLSIVTTQTTARTMVLDPATHRLFLAAGRLGPVPAATDDDPHPRAPALPNSFSILVAQPK